MTSVRRPATTRRCCRRHDRQMPVCGRRETGRPSRLTASCEEHGIRRSDRRRAAPYPIANRPQHTILFRLPTRRSLQACRSPGLEPRVRVGWNPFEAGRCVFADRRIMNCQGHSRSIRCDTPVGEYIRKPCGAGQKTSFAFDGVQGVIGERLLPLGFPQHARGSMQGTSVFVDRAADCNLLGNASRDGNAEETVRTAFGSGNIENPFSVGTGLRQNRGPLTGVDLLGRPILQPLRVQAENPRPIRFEEDGLTVREPRAREICARIKRKPRDVIENRTRV
jgi:hypothetical protein